MINKAKRPNKCSIQDRTIARNAEELENKYDLDNIDIYDYLDYLVDYLNRKGV